MPAVDTGWGIDISGGFCFTVDAARPGPHRGAKGYELLQTMRTSQLVGRTIGLLVFLGGIAMLVYVFVLGWRIFENPGFTGAAAGSGADGIVSHLVTVIVRLAFLLAMCVAGSLIASKGILLYGSLIHHPAVDASPAASRTTTEPRAPKSTSD